MIARAVSTNVRCDNQPSPPNDVPDPYAEIRIRTLSATRGANYWSRRPVTRIDLVVGAFEDISSADLNGFTERLVASLPGLDAHRCSIGERGGFITRLHRGTYMPHIVEHVALELQTMIGHDVGYGRSRGGDEEGEYTVTFEHSHEAVGQRAAALALETVQQAIVGSLGDVAHMVHELEVLANTPDVPRIAGHVTCGITGGSARAELRGEVARQMAADALIIDVSPSFLLHAGLPYRESDLAIVLDAELTDVPVRYREAERAQRLTGVVADAVKEGGIVVVPAKLWDLQDYARSLGCGVAVFSGANDITRRDRKVARSAAWVDGDELIIEHLGRRVLQKRVRAGAPPEIQAAAAMAVFSTRSIALSGEPARA